MPRSNPHLKTRARTSRTTSARETDGAAAPRTHAARGAAMIRTGLYTKSEATPGEDTRPTSFCRPAALSRRTGFVTLWPTMREHIAMNEFGMVTGLILATPESRSMKSAKGKHQVPSHKLQPVPRRPLPAQPRGSVPADACQTNADIALGRPIPFRRSRGLTMPNSRANSPRRCRRTGFVGPYRLRCRRVRGSAWGRSTETR